MSQPLVGHTVHRFDGELNQLHMLVLEMTSLVERQAHGALYALEKKDLFSAQKVIETENDVDAFELKIDNEVLSVIALRAPVASDLRVTMAFSKAVTDLERIGDEASRIAHLTMTMYDNEASDPSVYLLRDITTLGKIVLEMLHEAVETLYILDRERAGRLIDHHGELDVEFQSSLRRLSTFILEDARNVGHTVNVVLILKALERIGDHSRNLAEYVVFLREGEDIRHRAAANNMAKSEEVS